MNNKKHSMMFILLMIMGTLIAVTSTSWVTIWLGLEINLLSFMPILLYKNEFKLLDSSIKYLIIQMGASAIMIISFINQLNLTNNSIFMINNYLITIIVALKTAMAPLHLWLPQITESLEWFQVMIILTWQKIAPLWILSLLSPSIIHSMLIIFSAIMGSLGGITTNSLKKILTFSSINQSGWMVTAILMSKILWLNFFLVYTLMMALLVISIFKAKINFINQIMTSELNNITKLNITINIFSLAGLPPMLGFFPKLMVVKNMLNYWPNFFIFLSLILGTLISLVFYMKIILNTLAKPSHKKVPKINKATNYSTFLFINFMANLTMPVVMVYMN